MAPQARLFVADKNDQRGAHVRQIRFLYLLSNDGVLRSLYMPGQGFHRSGGVSSNDVRICATPRRDATSPPL